MSEGRGYYRMVRGWLRHPIFDGERFDRRSALCWLIEEAAYAPRRRSINGRTIELQRGQLTASLRFMAQAWGWSEAGVRRFIARLKTDAVIDAATDAGQLIITLCNYDKYQAAPGQPDAPTDAEDDARPTQERRRSDANDKELNKLNELNLFSFGEAGQDTAQQTFGAVLTYLKANSNRSVPQLRKVLGKLRKEHGDEAVILAARRARDAGASDPVAFMIATARTRNEKQHHQARPGGHRAGNAIAAAAELAAEPGEMDG